MRFLFYLAEKISPSSRFALGCLCGLALSASASGQAADGDLARRRAIESSVRLANTYYQETFSLGSAVWNRGAYHGGNMALYRTLRIAADRDYSLSWAAANQWLPGPEAGGGADADSQACGQAYLDLYELDPQPVRKAAIKAAMDALVASSASADDWWWVDAFYMAGPTLARLARIENDPAYLVQLEKMYGWMKTNRGLFDPARGLWYRDQTAKARTGANTPQFWGRGNGWAIAACARILEQLPAGDPRRAEFASMLQTMASALRPLQGADGFWRSNLLFPAQYPTPETSCTAFFTYAIAYGINEGLLDDATYRPVVNRAWDGMTALALNSAGRLGYVQAIGAAPAASTPDGQQDYGYGAFALAACEMLRLLGGPAPVSAVAGPDRRATDSAQVYETEVRLDASGSVLRDATPPLYSWWLGDVLLGQGRVLDVPLPLGRHQIRLVIQRPGETEPYADLVEVQVAPSPALALTVQASGFQTGNPPANSLDGSLATRWSQDGDGQWIAYTLPFVMAVGEVKIAFYQGDIRLTYFDLQTSVDGVSWTTVFSGASSGRSTAPESFTFSPVAARHIRYVGHGNSVSTWNSVTEFDVGLPGLLDRADQDGDGLPDAWEIRRLGSLAWDATADPGRIGSSLRDAYLLGRDPLDAGYAPVARLERDTAQTLRLVLEPRAALGAGYAGKTRRYRVLSAEDISSAAWVAVPGWGDVPGDNVGRVLPVAVPRDRVFFRVETRLE